MAMPFWELVLRFYILWGKFFTVQDLYDTVMAKWVIKSNS